MPATLTLIGILLVVGVVWGGLWSPFAANPLFDAVAYGLPALEEGRWWTPVTGTFFVDHPLVYAFVIPSFVGLAYLEHRRGSRAALAYFAIGQLFAIFASALFLWLAAMLPWPWAQAEAAVLDVGPSGGTMAGIAAAVGTPRRAVARARLARPSRRLVRHPALLGIARRPRARLRPAAHPVRRPVAAHPAHDRPRAAAHRVHRRPGPPRDRAAHPARPHRRTVRPRRPRTAARSSTSRSTSSSSPRSRTVCGAVGGGRGSGRIVLVGLQRADRRPPRPARGRSSAPMRSRIGSATSMSPSRSRCCGCCC